MAVHSDKVVRLAVQQDGDRYVFGERTRFHETDPEVFDCSELIQWVCGRLGVEPEMPDGSWIQAKHCKNHDTLIEIDRGVDTAGALLFRFSSNPFGSDRPDKAHVAFSLGDGRTMEARSTSLGVGIFAHAADRDWTHAGKIPGVKYGPSPQAVSDDGDVVLGDDEPNLQYVAVWQKITAAGIMNGKAPRRAMSRQEFAAILSRKQQLRAFLGIN